MVASVTGAWKTMRGGSVDALIDMDATLARGGSGGPLLSTDGKVLGINVYGLTRSGTTIPASTARRVAQALQQPGGIKRGRLGVGIQRAALSGSAETNAGQNAGVLITELESGGPADTAGLLVGDILLRVDGESVTGIRELAAALSTRGGSNARLGLLRGGEAREIEVALGVG
jgi:S1-C subfamily serine protease